MKIVPLFFVIVFASFIYTNAQNNNSNCYICHGQPTLSLKDSTYGIIQNFYVDSVAFNRSHHANLNCTDCHSEEFTTFPHPKTALSEHLECLDCHDNDLVIQGKKFSKINNELKKSVHYQAMGNKPDCSFCHDPHTIKLKTSPLWKIRNAYPIEDQMCVECHDTEYKWFKGGKQRVNLKAIHSTVSNNIQKWQEKKCIDCHTKDNAKHDIIFLEGIKDLIKK